MCISEGLINVRHKRRIMAQFRLPSFSLSLYSTVGATKILILLDFTSLKDVFVASRTEHYKNSDAAGLIFLRHQPQSKNTLAFSQSPEKLPSEEEKHLKEI